jgi:hypothetical protein
VLLTVPTFSLTTYPFHKLLNFHSTLVVNSDRGELNITYIKRVATIWSPHYDVYIKRLERVQKRFIWHVSFQSGLATKLPSYTERLLSIHMISLKNRHRMLDLLFLHKMVRGGLDCPGLFAQIQFHVPYNLPRVARFVPFAIRGSKSNLGHHSIINRLQRQYNDIQESGRRCILFEYF